MRTLQILTAFLVGLAACQPAYTPAERADPDTVTAGITCGADKLKHLIGTPVKELDESTLPERRRIYGPNTPLSADYNPTRLNIGYDKIGKITEVYCT